VHFLTYRYLRKMHYSSDSQSFTYILSLLLIFQMPIEIFISGKNWKLSLAELTAYFKSREIMFEIQFFSGEFFALYFEKSFDASIIADLGGTIKIGEVKAKFSTVTIKEAFLKKDKQAKKQIAAALASSGLVDGIAKSGNSTICRKCC
jgi:hypothetical protein